MPHLFVDWTVWPFRRINLTNQFRIAGLFLWAVYVFIPVGASSQVATQLDPHPAHLNASQVSGSITIDGQLSEADWEEAEVATGFTQQRPDPGAESSQKTAVRVLYDDTHLYVGMRMYDDAPDRVAAQLGRRGATDLYSDWAHVVIDSYGDHRTAFRFSVNAAGVKRDVLHYDDTNEDDSWQSVWESSVIRDSLGWSAEFQIPFSQLRFRTDSGEEMTWGINFIRDIARADERSFWVPIPPDAGRFVSLFGQLGNLREVPEPRRLEATPYASSQVEWGADDPSDPFSPGSAFGMRGGLDISYGIGSNLTLTGTVNPDFGQVEVDPAVVNLSAFETFFPERRPFFREGADIFQFGINLGDGGNESLFYTRRIGRTPQGSVPGEAVYSDMPGSSRILGAAKLSGRTGKWSVGGLNALTSAQSARWIDSEGDTHSTPVEPLTNYGVARASRDFRDGQSSIGGMITTVNRYISEDRLQFLPNQAYATGIDARHRFGDGNWEARGWLAGSHVRGHTSAIQSLQRAPGRYYQRPDADHVTFDPERTSLSGAAADITVQRVSGGSWRSGGLIHARSPGFEVNDLGFQRDKDQLISAVWLGRLSYDSGRHLRRWNLFSNVYTGTTWGGEHIVTGGNINGGLEFTSGWGGHAGIESQLPSLSTTATRGGPAILRSARSSMWGNVYSDRRKPLSLSLSVNSSHEYETGTGQIAIAPSLRVRPAPRFQFSIGSRWSHNVNSTQFVRHAQHVAGTDYVFGEIEQLTFAVDIRMNVAFTPDLSFELYAQPFTSLGRYELFRRVDQPRARDFDARFHTFEEGTELRIIDSANDRSVYGVFEGDGTSEPLYTFADPGFHTRSLRGNAVLRWEYSPGSTLFVVWQIDQFMSAAGKTRSFSPFDDYGQMIDGPLEQTLLIKLTKWFGR